MPIYEYECEACGIRHEALQKINDPVLQKCPECGKLSLKKLISAAGFRLSGSGWYETDFKSDNKRNLVSAEPTGKKETKEGVKSESKADSKTAKSTRSEKSTKSTSKNTATKSAQKP